MDGSFLQIQMGGQNYHAKVMDFTSDLQSQIASSQTRDYVQHFPSKVSQPNLYLSLQMRDQAEARSFQSLVRQTQGQALYRNTLANFFWPQRGIRDWTGAILTCQAGEKVGETSPILSIEVLLVDSLVSRRTWSSSEGSDFDEIYAGEIPDIPLLDPSGKKAPSVLQPPRPVTEDNKPIQGPYLGRDGVWR